MKRTLKRARQHGGVSVEMAFVTPVLLAMLFGIVQFGWLFNNYVTVTNAATMAAHQLASERGYSTPYTDTKNVVTSETSSLFSTPTITMSVGGTACSSDTTCATALGSSTQAPAAGTQATVALSYSFKPLLSGTLYSLGSIMPANLKSSMSDYVQ
jgi:Flp pilus assembly protein TadG